MILKFKKDHVAGLGVGFVGEFKHDHGNRLVNEGYAEKCSPEELKKFNFDEYDRKLRARKASEKQELLKSMDVREKKDNE